MLYGLKVPRGGWDGIPVLIDVCGYNLAERSVCTECVGRSEQGTFVMVQRSFDWYRCITDLLDLLVQPHSAMPYVHMGFSTVLYISILFSSERGEFFPINQFISLVYDQVVSFFL